MTGIDNPILNSPYAQPDRYYELGPKGPTGDIRDGRRPRESFIPIALSKKGDDGQTEFDFDATGERRQRNTLINDLRRDVERWRRDGKYGGVTPISRKLLQHWADPIRENRVLFCQREAAETAIFLTEVAGRKGVTDWRQRLEPENAAHNSGLPTVFGEPDIEVNLKGVDVYDPTTGQVRSNDTGQIALWMIDTNYNDESFFVRHCYFTGGNDPYKRLKVALNADIDADAWASLNSVVSRPFPKPDTGKIAVKVINDYGDEVMKIFEVD